MPELPEVQTVVSYLYPIVIGRKITKVIVHRNALRKDISGIPPYIEGKTIRDTRRRAKWPALVFDDGCLWMHLGMTGQIQHLFGTPPNGPHDHLDIYLDDGSLLRYHDPRRFGIVAWTNDAQSEPPTKTLGPEPLTTDFSLSEFTQALKKSNKAIKPLLMEGTLVVGVGNIYASEALFASSIHPDAPAKTLDAQQVEHLHASVVDVLTQAIDQGGSTLRDYRKPDGSTGDAQNIHFVYNRAYQPCLICQTKIKTAIHAGRSTFWCPTCQPWKKAYANG